LNLLIGQESTIIPYFYSYKNGSGTADTLQMTTQPNIPASTTSGSISNPDTYVYNATQTRGRFFTTSTQMVASESGQQGFTIRTKNMTIKSWLRQA